MNVCVSTISVTVYNFLLQPAHSPALRPAFPSALPPRLATLQALPFAERAPAAAPAVATWERSLISWMRTLKFKAVTEAAGAPDFSIWHNRLLEPIFCRWLLLQLMPSAVMLRSCENRTHKGAMVVEFED